MSVSRKHQANHILPDVFVGRVLLRRALGKYIICRVPDKKNQANDLTPGKSRVSCSVGSNKARKCVHSFLSDDPQQIKKAIDNIYI